MQSVQWMLRALELANKGVGFTSPNPAVGAVIVKNRKIVGQGYHHKAGGKHAEAVALKGTTNKEQGTKEATMYVTMEPCCHTGKTPPCVDAIVAAGIKRVVVGMIDPIQHTNTKGIQELRRRGVRVDVLDKTSVLAREIRKLNQPFVKWAKTGLPYVILKAAVSLDGKIATRVRESKWITSAEAREDARLERSRWDAVLIGAGTVFVDDPELGAHGAYEKKRLLRIAIDPELKLPLTKKIFRDGNVFVATTGRASAARRKQYERRGVEFRSFGKTRVSLPALLKFLAKRNIQSMFVEGGSVTHGAFYDARLVDKVIFYIAPKIIGGVDGLSAVGGAGIATLSEALALRDVRVEKIGDDIKVEGAVHWY